MNEDYIRGWDEIEQMFPAYAPRTIRRKYGKEMLKRGFVFKSRTGPRKNVCEVWSFKPLVLGFITRKQEEQGYV